MYHKGLLTYAIDSQSNLVYVGNVARGLACNCYCPACKERLVAKNGGEKRIHHFAHASGVDCEGSYETMLHQLAKIRIQEAFLNKSEFNIRFEQRSYCSKTNSCGLVRHDNCCTSIIKDFNLKDFYDSCEQEVKYDSINRRSDLKLFSSKHPQRQPIYIEFYVTHASDDFKLHNGGKVIEVKIESEKDIEKIVENGFIESLRYGKKNMYYEAMDEAPKTTFCNFKIKAYNNDNICRNIEFSRYILYPSGNSQCYLDISSCRNIVKVKKQSLLEICFCGDRSPKCAHKTGMYYGYSKFKIKNCPICKYYVEDSINKICWFKDKNLGVNIKRPLFDVGSNECPDFVLNTDMMYFKNINTILLE